MNTLWIFGNSFSTTAPNKNTWIKQIAQALGYELENLSYGGSSLDYMFEQFNAARHKLKPNDVVIITLSDLYRRWVVRDEPDSSLNLRRVVAKEGDDRAAHASLMYWQYLDNELAFENCLLNFLHNVDYNAGQKNIKTVLLPGYDTTLQCINKHKHKFKNLTITDYPLVLISKAEFKRREFAKSGLMRNMEDLRANHITASNHKVLADKIIHNIRTSEPITLHTDFLSDFLTCEMLVDVRYSSKELYDTHLESYYPIVHDYIAKKLGIV